MDPNNEAKKGLANLIGPIRGRLKKPSKERT